MRSRHVLAALTLTLLLSPHLPAQASILDARLHTLRLRGGPGYTALKANTEIAVTVRFQGPPDAQLLANAAAAGLRLHRVADARVLAPGKAPRPGEVLGARTIFPGRIRVDDLDKLAAVPGVQRVEATGAPGRSYNLHQTRALIGTDDAWNTLGADLLPLRGEGVVLADFDTGVDMYHPDHWRADGNVVTWLDVDSSGDYSDGDAIDVNGNFTAEADEMLRWLDAPGPAPGLDETLQLDIDHFYQDLNDNGSRDFGPGAGFTESDPTYGEPVFRPLDTNDNGLLDVGEQLVALSSSSVSAVMESDGTVRRFGIDLIQNEGDFLGHGTNVGSIIAGGDITRRFGGIAPATTLLFGNLDFSADDAVFQSGLALAMAWAAAEGADIMIYEFGGWVWEYLDGSSNIEQLINEYASDGIIQLTASGNLNTGGMHWEKDLGASPGDSLVATLDSDSGGDPITDIFGNFYWIPDGGAVSLEVQAPTGEIGLLNGSGATATVGDYEVYHLASTSPRGTFRFDFHISVGDPPVAPNLHGMWRFTLRRAAPAKTGDPLRVYAMVVDNISGWFGNSVWLNAVQNNTVTWPATADSAITTVAYNPNLGTINNFSGKGLRVDGVRIIDLATPGSPTYTGYRNQARGGVPGGYGVFGGTSAALPHTAGAVALLKQWDPSLTNGEVRNLLRAGAQSDANTGAVPNSVWGEGKLNIFASMGGTPTAAPAPATLQTVPEIAQNVPNPFNPATNIRYRLPAAGKVEVVLFDLRGRRVATLVQGQQAEGDHSVVWRGLDDSGRAVGSGVYLVRVDLDGQESSRKITLLR